MGLDIRVQDGENVWHSSYSGVQHIRILMVKATIKYLENKIKESDEDDDDEDTTNIDYYELNERSRMIKVKTYLESWLNDDGIVYSNIKKIDKLTEFNLTGLHWFVNHCDCEGYLSVGQAYDIQILFEYIDEYMEELLKEDYDWFKQLSSLIDESVKLNSRIIFF
jgi:hypothetical protein